jgi:hypothetical protein
MSDPHIDIDDGENPPPKGEQAKATSNTDGIGFDDPDQNGSGPGNYSGFSDIFRRFRNKSGFGAGRESLDEVFPPEARQHFRASQREFLLGWRNIIDRNLERLAQYDERDSQTSPEKPTSKPDRIVVEEVDL